MTTRLFRTLVTRRHYVHFKSGASQYAPSTSTSLSFPFVVIAVASKPEWTTLPMGHNSSSRLAYTLAHLLWKERKRQLNVRASAEMLRGEFRSPAILFSPFVYIPKFIIMLIFIRKFGTLRIFENYFRYFVCGCASDADNRALNLNMISKRLTAYGMQGNERWRDVEGGRRFSFNRIKFNVLYLNVDEISRDNF